MLGMIAFLVIKPKQFYDERGNLKTWKQINFDRIDTLYNIYVYAIVLAFISFHMSK